MVYVSANYVEPVEELRLWEGDNVLPTVFEAKSSR